MENVSLVADLLEWVAPRPRPYEEVLDAWRTTCPRLSVWEDTLAAEFLRLGLGSESAETIVCITPQGVEFLKKQGRVVAEPAMPSA